MSSEPANEKLTVTQLRERAAKLKIPGRSSMDKAELVAAVADAESSGSSEQDSQADGGDKSAEAASKESKSKESTTNVEEAGDMSAPSIGPHTTIVTEAPEDRLARGNPSQVDAMGQDKRRSVMGQSYGPSVGRQLAVYGIFVAVVAALFFAASIAVKELDKPDPSRTDTAPWAAAEAPPVEPAPIDFPRSVTP